eukprot:Skav204090  [mRNA]  locus=scaffold3129:371114:378324:+ [translate_table: standard]
MRVDPAELSQLRDEVASLTELVRDLRLQLTAAEERLSILESRTPGGSSTAAAGFSAPATTAPAGPGYRVGSHREAVAKQIGDWIRRGLEGLPLGPSGRDQVSERSRCYIVVRDSEGVVHDPPRFFERWSECATYPIGMVGRWNMGRASFQSMGRSQSQGSADDCLLRPTGLRQRGLASSPRADFGKSAALRGIPIAPSTGALGHSTYPSHRQSVVRPVHEQIEGACRVPGEESQADECPSSQRRILQGERQERQGKRERSGVGRRDPGRSHHLREEKAGSDEGCRQKLAFPSHAEHSALDVPGAKAPVSNVLKLWNSLVRWMVSDETPLACYVRSLRSQLPESSSSTASPLWPMPVPYPRWMMSSSGKPANYKRMCIEKAINSIVFTLSWLHLGKPWKAPAEICLGASLTQSQKAVVRRFERLLQELAETGDFGPSSMGRSAAKMENLDAILLALQEDAQMVSSGYEHRAAAQKFSSARLHVGCDEECDATWIGTLKNGAPQLAKSVEPSRLSFPKDAPTFDPTKYFDEPHKTVYQDPISVAMSPEECLVEPPRVRIHASRPEALELLRFLDEHHRLKLVPEKKIRKGFLCGAFCLVKDEKKDRLILDARPPNMLEETLRSWSKTLGSISAVLQLELLPDHKLSMSGTDLRDYYYCFKVQRARAERNSFNFPVKPSEVADFTCFKEHLHSHQVLYPCLSTMAMGDCQAVELGQKCHVKLGMSIDVFKPEELLCVHGRAPRGKIACGVIIDDALFLEQVPTSLSPKDMLLTEGAARLRAIREEYIHEGLTPHPDKTFEAEEKCEFWGSSVDGVAGTVRAAPRRLVPLMLATSKTIRLGVASVGLLQTLAGSWISVLQYRRRMLCLLDLIYEVQQGRQQEDIVQLSPKLRDEMWVLVALAPLAVTDLRAASLGHLFLTDASEDAKAAVVTDVPVAFARELQRHTLSRGAWSRLLSPWKVWLQQHFSLDEEDMLPGGVPLVSHPLWLELAKTMTFRVYQRKLVRSRKHINLLELEALVELEAKIAARNQDARYLAGSDSQVALAAILKGRSSSSRLNRILLQSLPLLLGAGLYGGYGYVPSLANVGDDPTRWTDVRTPSKKPERWLLEALECRFELMDQWLGERGYDPIAVAQLPFAPKFSEDADVLLSSFLPDLRAVQKPQRLVKFDAKVYGQETFLHEHVLEDIQKSACCPEKPVSRDQLADAGDLELQDQEMKRPQESFEDWPTQAVASPLGKKMDEGESGSKPCPPIAGESSDDTETRQNMTCTAVGSLDVDMGQKEPEGQTKRADKKPSGKMNRGHYNSVALEGQSQPVNSSNRSPLTGPLGPPGSAGSSDAMVELRENVKAADLSGAALDLLQEVPADWFILPGGRRGVRGEKLSFRKQGGLDLFSGKSAVARSLARRFKIWVLTVDYAHGSDRDLLDEGLRDRLCKMVDAGCFSNFGAAPECCSFSRAVHPPVRSALRPEGLDGLSERMREKVRIGNSHASFLLKLLKKVERLRLPYWVENPDGSFLWLLGSWNAAGFSSPWKSFRFDMCRYSTPWRKRTRILTNTILQGRRELCHGMHQHVILRGRNRLAKQSWTRLAQVYPLALASDLASALGCSLQLLPKSRKLHIGGCAKCGDGRIGEASHPGPRHRNHVPRDLGELRDVTLVEPATSALQFRVYQAFRRWLETKLSSQAREEIMLSPTLLVYVLQSYGYFLFGSGKALYEFRHLLVVMQQSYPWIRQHMSPAWMLVTKWESLQPIQHRKPLHAVLFKAMVSMGLLKGWTRWTATLILGFEGIARISEVLRALRGDLVLPMDQFESSGSFAFLKVSNPKTKRRGRGRVQHLKLRNPEAIRFLEKSLGSLAPSLSLFPFSAAAFRARWDQLLDELLLPKTGRPTPASIRGGGAILAYQRGEPIQDIMWRMRVTNQRTLEHYLQEMAADAVLSRLPLTCKSKIRSAAALFQILLEHSVSSTSNV